MMLENASIERPCKEKFLGITFEFSGPRIPQRNGKVERRYQTSYERVRSMLNHTGIKDEMRRGMSLENQLTNGCLH
jgi:transposase InsO family protein